MENQHKSTVGVDEEAVRPYNDQQAFASLTDPLGRRRAWLVTPHNLNDQRDIMKVKRGRGMKGK